MDSDVSQKGLKKPKKADNRFKKILRELNIKQNEFAERIGYSYAYINKKICDDNITPGLAQALNEFYNVSYDYINGKSDTILDSASIAHKNLPDIFPQITLTPQKYMKDGVEEENEFLLFSVEKSLYEFLKKVAFSKYLFSDQEISSSELNSRIEEARKEYHQSKNTTDMLSCLLIPSEEVPYIVEEEKKRQAKMKEVQRILVWNYQANEAPIRNFKLTKKNNEQPSSTKKEKGAENGKGNNEEK